MQFAVITKGPEARIIGRYDNERSAVRHAEEAGARVECLATRPIGFDRFFTLAYRAKRAEAAADEWLAAFNEHIEVTKGVNGRIVRAALPAFRAIARMYDRPVQRFYETSNFHFAVVPLAEEFTLLVEPSTRYRAKDAQLPEPRTLTGDAADAELESLMTCELLEGLERILGIVEDETCEHAIRDLKANTASLQVWMALL
jgi:hypothetical protein